MDGMEIQMQRYKDKISELEYFKTRLDDALEDNTILMETKDMLEKQLENSRTRSDKILQLEDDLLRAKTDINNLQIEREHDK